MLVQQSTKRCPCADKSKKTSSLAPGFFTTPTIWIDTPTGRGVAMGEYRPGYPGIEIFSSNRLAHAVFAYLRGSGPPRSHRRPHSSSWPKSGDCPADGWSAIGPPVGCAICRRIGRRPRLLGLKPDEHWHGPAQHASWQTRIQSRRALEGCVEGSFRNRAAP